MGSYFLQGFQVSIFPNSNFKPIIYCQMTGIEFMRPYSQQKFMEESEISWNLTKSFQSTFEIVTTCIHGIISLCRFNDEATGPLI